MKCELGSDSDASFGFGFWIFGNQLCHATRNLGTHLPLPNPRFTQHFHPTLPESHSYLQKITCLIRNVPMPLPCLGPNCSSVPVPDTQAIAIHTMTILVLTDAVRTLTTYNMYLIGRLSVEVDEGQEPFAKKSG